MVSGASRDVVVIGDGLIGLSTALALGRAGASCTVIGTTRSGAASAAAAGLLVPWSTTLADEARPLFAWALSLYPEFVASLRQYDDDLRIIEGLDERVGGQTRFRADEGAIDNVRLLAAVRRAAGDCSSVSIVEATVSAIEPRTGGIAVRASGQPDIEAGRIVLAAGAWSAQIEGLPRVVPVRPLKGQMIALGAAPLKHPVMGDDVYLVPRGKETLVGATVEEAGFDVTVTAEAIAALRTGAVELCPDLRGAPVTRSWAGSRPASPDLLPILGPDPDLPSLLYACGHSKNGILLAPATARAMADWCAGKATPEMLRPFGIGRFQQ